MSDAVIEVKGLRKQFGESVILDDLSITVNKGEAVVLVGPSGCGKSTLLRCLNGLEPIQSGTILLHGEPVEYGKKNLARLRRRIGMVFQNYDLFPNMNVLKNITLAPQKVLGVDKLSAEEEGLQLLERVGLSGKENSYPNELSGGQRQRVAIVRSLMLHPDIMLFDEITAALDPEMVHEVLKVVLDLAKSGTTMMIVTHEMAFARTAADRVLFLDGGKIVEENTPESFFTSPKTERAKQFLGTFEY